MRELQWEYLSIAMAEHDGMRIDATYISNALSKMSVDGVIAPLLDTFKDRVLSRISNRDLMQFNEKR